MHRAKLPITNKNVDIIMQIVYNFMRRTAKVGRCYIEVMIINIFNYTYIITLLAAALFIGAVYFPLRNRSVYAKETALYVLMGFNVSQHFFKFIIWPHCWGTGFGYINTAYNVCAILIISTPIIYVFGHSLLRQYVTYVGTIGATMTLFIPFWFLGNTILTWEYLRFWTCHVLLAATSLLPALWGLVKFDWRDGWKFGLIFLVMLSLILLNNTLYMVIFDKVKSEDLYEALRTQNPIWMMGPFGGVESVRPIFEGLSPGFLLETSSHPHIPILWYAVPVYIGITVAGYLLGFACDWKRLLGTPKTMLKADKLIN